MATLMPQACERCWKRKQKCDRKKPCLHCKNTGSLCVERRLGATLDPTDPHASHSYIESLKRKIQLLEEKLESSQPTPGVALASPSSHHGSQPPDNGDVRQPIERRGSSNTRARKSSLLPYSDSLQTEIGYLSLSSMAEFTGGQPLSTPTVAFQTLVQAAIGVSGNNPSTSDSPNAAIFGPLGDFHRGLLRQGLTLTTVETEAPFRQFVDMSKFLLSFVGVEGLAQDYQLVIQAHESGLITTMITDSPSKVISVYLAVAIGVLLGKDFRYTESYATALALLAYQILPRAISEDADLDVVQCLLMLTVYAMLSPFGGSAWHLLGLAITRCISAGMHNARVSQSILQGGEETEQSKIFWSAYVLDALMSTSLGRPFHLQDEDITTPAPSIQDCQDPAEEIQCWNLSHAKLLHEVHRNSPKGSLFHFFNYRHWRDTSPSVSSESGIMNLHYYRLCCKCLVLMLQSPDLSPLFLKEAKQDLSAYLAAIEEYSTRQGGILTVFDALDILGAGACLVYVSYLQDHESNLLLERSGVTSRVSRLLSIASERWPSTRHLYNIHAKFSSAITVTVPGSNLRADLEADILVSEIPVPRTIEWLLQTSISKAEAISAVVPNHLTDITALDPIC